MSYIINLLKKLAHFVMAVIANSEKPKNFKNPIELDKEELEFILAKLRLSTYKGDEFEMFYNVWVKLSNKLDSLK